MHLRALEKNALALIDHELRFLNGRRRMREMLLNGEIGEVWHAKLIFRGDSRANSQAAWNWWSDEKMGGGALGAIGSHAVDSFRWLFNAEVSQVFCSLATHVKMRPAGDGELRDVTTDDEANLTLRFAETALTKTATATASLSVIESGEAEHRLEIFGSRGALKVEERGELWHAPTGAGKWTRVDVEQSEVARGMGDKGWQQGFTQFSRRIVEALREKRNVVDGAATFDDGYRTQLVLDAAQRSHKSGCWINF
jgi:predicted dehydrogenase